MVKCFIKRTIHIAKHAKAVKTSASATTNICQHNSMCKMGSIHQHNMLNQTKKVKIITNLQLIFPKGVFGLSCLYTC